jgi:hypothetical protein
MEHNTTMERDLDCIMEHYSEALEELMGAQAYAKKAYHAGTMEERTKYSQMSRQELAHAEELKQMAMTRARNDTMLMAMWNHLQDHIDSWRENILEKLKKAEHKAM